jgi:hypothetical protein
MHGRLAQHLIFMTIFAIILAVLGGCTQGLVVARQALYHLSDSTSPLCWFSYGVLLFA